MWAAPPTATPIPTNTPAPTPIPTGASASSVYIHVNNPLASKAYDDDLNTYWMAGGLSGNGIDDAEWWQYNLGSGNPKAVPSISDSIPLVESGQSRQTNSLHFSY